ncbi:MAG: tyrosine-protein phosphatase [Gemmatales bacterium]|nr:tyrosine-protein phosphatase [Gemmatales bacterium]MDW7994280.1 tyrosine-protein phosphatase [Gemmatales bacterium]
MTKEQLPNSAHRANVPSQAVPLLGCNHWYRAVLLGVLLTALVGVGLTAAHYRYNFHEVRPGQLYRSGQLPNDVWESVLKQYRIRAVINLRGRRPGRDWYEAETRAAQRCGAVHVDLAMNRQRLPDLALLSELMRWHRTLPRPVLIHCQAGSDRTSMVVVLWLLLESDANITEARAQTGLWFGQLPWRRGARQLRCLLDSYQSYLERQQCEHSPTCFRAWLGQHYEAVRESGEAMAYPGLGTISLRKGADETP